VNHELPAPVAKAGAGTRRRSDERDGLDHPGRLKNERPTRCGAGRTGWGVFIRTPVAQYEKFRLAVPTTQGLLPLL
jgi:hypothetical protein